MKKSTFEQMDGTYREEGDHLLPNLTVPGEHLCRHLGQAAQAVSTEASANALHRPAFRREAGHPPR